MKPLTTDYTPTIHERALEIAERLTPAQRERMRSWHESLGRPWADIDDDLSTLGLVTTVRPQRSDGFETMHYSWRTDLGAYVAAVVSRTDARK